MTWQATFVWLTVLGVPVSLALIIALLTRRFASKDKKGNKKFFWETVFTWFMRLLVAPLVGFAILGLCTKGYNTTIAALAFGFLIAVPINIVLTVGWIAQEIHFYKFKKRISDLSHANT